MFQAANASSEMSQSTVQIRNTNIDDQLRKKNLHSINVRGDGNCFFALFQCFCIAARIIILIYVAQLLRVSC